MKKQNNGLIKNPFLWLLLIFLLVTGYQYFSTGSVAGKSEQINYTELVKEITDDKCKRIDLPTKGSGYRSFRCL